MQFVCGLVIGLIVGAVLALVLGIKGVHRQRESIRKLLAFYRLLVRWLHIRLHGRGLAEYLEKNGYQNIAIYGKKELGELLYTELESSSVNVSCFIDRDADYIISEIEMIRPDEINQYQVDAIIVTAVTYYNEIAENLKNYTSCPVISLSSVINAILRTVRDGG